MKTLRKIYGIWGVMCFTIPLIFLLPFFHLFALRDEWHIYSSWLNRFWARIFFIGILVPYHVEYRFKAIKKQPYVYCSNHTSWLDIIIMGIIAKGDHTFIGKSSLIKLPLFGPMFKKLHITVDRNSRQHSYQAFTESMKAIDKGRSVIVFPEGGIRGTAPYLNDFKDGAFRIAIEKQIPLVPVSILYNWKIMDKSFLPKWHWGKAIVHPPLDTKGLTLEDLESLKAKTRESIEKELKTIYPLVYETK
ncbi:MAG: lysophospholipid acyltransferase family protein [Microscillaceae bacterium]|nr:lysophospholipid acyltransferase family protein [Microscillaceae bacterium]